MFKLILICLSYYVYLTELVDINLASNTSIMMSLSLGYPQILASGYPDSKFTIRFSPTDYTSRVISPKFHPANILHYTVIVPVVLAPKHVAKVPKHITNILLAFLCIVLHVHL